MTTTTGENRTDNQKEITTTTNYHRPRDGSERKGTACRGALLRQSNQQETGPSLGAEVTEGSERDSTKADAAVSDPIPPINGLAKSNWGRRQQLEPHNEDEDPSLQRPRKRIEKQCNPREGTVPEDPEGVQGYRPQTISTTTG